MCISPYMCTHFFFSGLCFNSGPWAEAGAGEKVAGMGAVGAA